MENRLFGSGHGGSGLYDTGVYEGLLRGGSGSTTPNGVQGPHSDDVEAGEDNQRKRQFLRRLAIALVSYGSSSSRTEYLISQVGERLNVKLDIGVFCTAIFLVFPGSGDPTRDETYMDRIEGETNVAKLQEVDEIANSVGLPGTPLPDASQRLASVVKRASPYGSWSTLFGYTITAPTAALLFFDGGIWDAAFASLLGFVVGLVSLYSSAMTALESIEEFVSAIFVSFTARLISEYFQHLGVCFSSIALSALVWLLPGQALTVGVSEVVDSSIITGASRIVRALVASLQLGFGLVVGEKLMFWGKTSVRDCNPVEVSGWWDILWILAFSVGANVLLKARPWQWPGMIIAACAGLVMNNLTDGCGTEVAAVFASFAIELTAFFYSKVSRDIPATMTLAGIQVLLPGGLGVQGVEAFMEHDVLSGVDFVIAMINISLSITLGLLVGKVFVSDKMFNRFMQSRKKFGSTLEEERWKQAKDSQAKEDEQITL
ncbi:hypothetical protein R1sor_017766 [Riccia sorocarpa]|uniref:Threonine/serine exporter-like N-terminal domain-containing protein n=1 Tax=Riccia sorocarpa TaxID=122646 RepID=A0ABD3I9M0_9MARC